MRKTVNLNKNWYFTGKDDAEVPVDVPHTWNNLDGQDGGNDGTDRLYAACRFLLVARKERKFAVFRHMLIILAAALTTLPCSQSK